VTNYLRYHVILSSRITTYRIHAWQLSMSCWVCARVKSDIERFLVFADPNGPVTRAPGHEGPRGTDQSTIANDRKRTCHRKWQQTKSERRIKVTPLIRRCPARAGSPNSRARRGTLLSRKTRSARPAQGIERHSIRRETLHPIRGVESSSGHDSCAGATVAGAHRFAGRIGVSGVPCLDVRDTSETGKNDPRRIETE